MVDDDVEELPQGVAPTGSHQLAPSTAAVIVILLVLGIGVSALRLLAPTRAQPSDVDLSIPDWHITPDEIVSLSKLADGRRAAAPELSSAEVAPLLAAFEAFNAADIAHRGDRRSRALKDVHAEYKQWARTALQTLGDEGFMGLGQVLSDQFITSLKRGEGERVRQLSGSFSVAMRATGLINDEGRPVSSQAWRIAAIGFLTHWCGAVMELRPVDELLTPLERTALLRWKLAANPLLAPDRREAVGAALRQMGSDYPVFRAIAARAAADGDWVTAARFYRSAASQHPEDVSLRANAALAEARARH